MGDRGAWATTDERCVKVDRRVTADMQNGRASGRVLGDYFGDVRLAGGRGGRMD
jgi:hypothetical protein